MDKCLVVSVFAAVLVSLGLSLGEAAAKAGYSIESVTVMDRLTFDKEPTVSVPRQVINIPQDYGKIIGSYFDDKGAAFWFEAGDGKIRNVIIPEAVRPVMIRRSGKLE